MYHFFCSFQPRRIVCSTSTDIFSLTLEICQTSNEPWNDKCLIISFKVKWPVTAADKEPNINCGVEEQYKGLLTSVCVCLCDGERSFSAVDKWG